MAYWMRAEPMDAEQRADFDEVLDRTPEEWAEIAEAAASADRQARLDWLEEMRLLGYVG